MPALLSDVDAMPGLSWGQPAGPGKCAIVNMRRKGICKRCYALKGRYRFQNVKQAQAWRWEWWHNKPENEVIETLVSLIRFESYFRLFDSGDFCHVPCAWRWVRICSRLPQTRIWIPTRVWQLEAYHDPLRALNLMPHVCVRLSNKNVDEAVPDEVKELLNIHTVGEVHSHENFKCPKQIHGSCTKAGCVGCWDKSEEYITYQEH